MPLGHHLNKYRTAKMCPSKPSLWLMLQYRESCESREHIHNKSISSANFTPWRAEWAQVGAYKWHSGSLVRSVPTLPSNLLQSVSRHVPSHPFLAIHAKYFFTVRAVIFHFVTLPFNCHWSDTNVYPRKRKDNSLNYHVLGTHSLLNITVAEWLLPCTLLRLTLTMLVHSALIDWFYS